MHYLDSKPDLILEVIYGLIQLLFAIVASLIVIKQIKKSDLMKAIIE